jgi:glutamate-1-semialdehyde 2,1-aminomutase
MKKNKKLFKEALKYIPLASQTFSKSHKVHFKDISPYFLKRGDGCYVWDEDNNKYIDLICALLPIIIGYNNKGINYAIIKQLKKGISFSLPTKIETELSKLLCKIIPSAEMVRFGKNGSDVTAAAIRLSRAYTKRDKIIFCGYHGWHDWYIGKTSMSIGVPNKIKTLTKSFKYNDINSLEKILKKEPNNFAAVIMEPVYNIEPKDKFLEKVKKITKKYGCLLVFDEIVTGFRVHLKGAQHYYGVTPDISCFGKAMANGMPISAIVGKKKIMKNFDKIFFSTTFGGETLSLAAALATIKYLQKEDVINKIKKFSNKLIRDIKKIIYNLNLNKTFVIEGVWWRPAFGVCKGVDKLYLEVLRKNLIKNKLLIGNSFNFCYAHTNINTYKEIITRIETSLKQTSKTKLGIYNYVKKNSVRS